MNRKHEQYFTVIMIVVTMLTSLFVVSTVSNLSTGIGFGKDSKLIITTETPQELEQFLYEQIHNYHDIDVKHISEDTFLITMSLLESSEEFKEMLTESVPNSRIVLEGSFGTITKLNNTESFAKLSLMITVLLVFLYFVYRFKQVGWLSAVILVFSLITPLFILNVAGYSFTFLLWIVVLLTLILLIYQHNLFMAQHVGKSLKEVLHDQENLMRYGKNLFIQNLMIAGTGLICLLLPRYQFESVGAYLIVVALLANVVVFGLMRSLSKWLLQHPDDLEAFDFMVFANRKLISLQSPIAISFSVFMRFVVTLGIILALFGIVSRPVINLGPNFAHQSIMVVLRSQPEAYLEVQADLIEEGVYTHQIDYEVSEQEHTWIYFDDATSYTDLQKASQEFASRSGIDVLTFSVYPHATQDISWNIIIYLALPLLALLILNLTSKSWRVSLKFLLLQLIAHGMFAVLIWVLNLEVSYQTALVFLMMPLLLNFYYDSLKRKILFGEQEIFYSAMINSLTLNSVILGAICIPMIIVTPTLSTYTMVQILLIAFLAIYLSIFLCFMVYRLLRKRENA